MERKLQNVTALLVKLGKQIYVDRNEVITFINDIQNYKWEMLDMRIQRCIHERLDLIEGMIDQLEFHVRGGPRPPYHLNIKQAPTPPQNQ